VTQTSDAVYTARRLQQQYEGDWIHTSSTNLSPINSLPASGLTPRTSRPDRFFRAYPFYVSSFLIILFCLVPCGILSWLLVSFWAHVNIVHHIISFISYHIISYILTSGVNRDFSDAEPFGRCVRTSNDDVAIQLRK